MEPVEGDVCYICLGEDGQLIRPCACRSLQCHQSCLARWQLQSAGKEEEKQCRFCKQDLPPWKAAFAALTQQPEAGHVPVMSIQFNGQKYWLEVRPGVGGVEQFKEDVRKLLGLHPDQAFDITFECRVPIPLAGNSKLELQGLQAYDAAVYCAALTAAQRKQKAHTDDKRFVWSSTSAGSESGSSSSSSSSSNSSGRSSTASDSDGESADHSRASSLHLTEQLSSHGSSLDGVALNAVTNSFGTSDQAAGRNSGSTSSGRWQAVASLRPCLLSRLFGALKVLWHLSDDDALF